MSPEVRHEPERRRFVLPLEGGEEAVVEYRPAGDSLDLCHTYVPPEFRGRGLAERVVRAAFAHARAQGLKVVASCSYVGTYLRRHPEERDLL